MNESPKQCCQREVSEELALNRTVETLLVVDYNFPTEEKTESLMFIFNGGELTQAETEAIVLRLDELIEAVFFYPEVLPNEMSKPLRNRILAAWTCSRDGKLAYFENQQLI